MPKPLKDPRSPYFYYDFQRDKRRFYGSTRCKTERKAQAFIDRKIAAIEKGDYGKEEITLDAACLAYWTDKAMHKPSHKTTFYQLANLCTFLGKNKPLSAIGIKEFRDYIAARRTQVSPASVNREWQLARRVWKHIGPDYAVKPIDWGQLALAEPKERVRELKADEEARLFASLPDSLKPIVEFAILSGQRKSAVIGLRRDKINWRAGEATIINKGGGEHTFPLSDSMIELLLEQPVVDGCPFVFTYVCERPAPKRKDRPARRKGHRYPFSAQGWDRKWRKALEDAGLPDFRFHDLRHTSATRIMRSTGNIKAASRLLGHTDIRTTSRYAHVGMDDLRNVMSVSESRTGTGKRLTHIAETRINPSESET